MPGSARTWSTGRRLLIGGLVCAMALTVGIPTLAGRGHGPRGGPGGEAGQLTLRDIGYIVIGADTVAQPNGTLNVVNQMVVTYMLPAKQKHKYPLVLVHGGGGQGTDWLGTPDGRDGWADYFVRAGFDVYVVDRPGLGRSPTNPSCGQLGGPGNTGIISNLADSAPERWPGGAPTPTNAAVIGWAATSPGGPYCGNTIAARDIALLLDRIGPAILVSHSAGGTSTWWAADQSSDNVVGVIAFEAGGNPTGNIRTGLTFEPALPPGFQPVVIDGCALQGTASPSQLVNYTFPVVAVGSEFNSSPQALGCIVASLEEAGVDADSLYLPDAGHTGGGHFSMAQLDNGKIAKTFIEIATDIEKSRRKGR
jgi:pimeloyl-ACP methyl ester carboxylesterase